MFEIIDEIGKDDYGTGTKHFLVWNGNVVDGVKVLNKSTFGIRKIFELETVRSNATDYLLNFCLKDFRLFTKLTFFDWKQNDNFDWILEIELLHLVERYNPCIRFRIIPKFAFWKNNYSFVEFKNLFTDILLEHFIELEFLKESQSFNELDEMVFVAYKSCEDFSLRQEIEKYVNALEKVYFETSELLKTEKHILSAFNFPKDLKIPCEQYLLYFAQFLSDLGINATSDLQEESGKVLFSVMPTDDFEALDKIREALAVYLKLPESPIVYDDSFAAMRLQQQIENLQHSQRMAARELQFNDKLLTAQSEMIHEKNVTISQLQSVTDQQQKIIEKISSKSIMMDSVENKEELEEVYDGLKVGESKWLYEKTGIKANPLKIIKTAVKNTFGKDGEKKSILGLDEET